MSSSSTSKPRPPVGPSSASASPALLLLPRWCAGSRCNRSAGCAKRWRANGSSSTIRMFMALSAVWKVRLCVAWSMVCGAPWRPAGLAVRGAWGFHRQRDAHLVDRLAPRRELALHVVQQCQPGTHLLASAMPWPRGASFLMCEGGRVLVMRTTTRLPRSSVITFSLPPRGWAPHRA